MIFVIGALMLSVLTVGLGISMFSGSKIPEPGTINVSKPGKMADLVEGCWRESGRGTSMERMDCFRVFLESDMEASSVRARVENVPQQRFEVPDIDFSSVDVAKVSYLPETRTVNVSKVN
jgi:hypothetical protein